MVKRMSTTAIQKWTAAGFEVQACSYWKEGQRTVALYMELEKDAPLPDNHEAVIQRLAKSQKLLAFTKDPAASKPRSYQLIKSEELAVLVAALEIEHNTLRQQPEFLKAEGAVETAVYSLASLKDLLHQAVQEAKTNNTRKAGVGFIGFLNAYLDNEDLFKVVASQKTTIFPALMSELEERWYC